LHPVPLIAEFQLTPNWAESYFDYRDEKAVAEIKFKHAIPDNSLVFIFCGGDILLKGWFLMQRALKKIALENKKCITIILTGGRERENEIYSDKVRIIYTGLLDPRSLASYYRVAQFGLFPSLGGYEHAPVTIIEMIKCNVLPIASDVGGIKEMLGDHYAFLIDTPHIVDVWIEKIESISELSDKEKNELLLTLKKRMEGYKRPIFKNLINDILSES
jgi:glycosyltransferase involved in cell wall biosynthesis